MQTALPWTASRFISEWKQARLSAMTPFLNHLLEEGPLAMPKSEHPYEDERQLLRLVPREGHLRLFHEVYCGSYRIGMVLKERKDFDSLLAEADPPMNFDLKGKAHLDDALWRNYWQNALDGLYAGRLDWITQGLSAATPNIQAETRKNPPPPPSPHAHSSFLG